MTETTSNVATVLMLSPAIAAMAGEIGVHPYLLLLPMAVTASFAFTMPVATPPNAIIFSSGWITIPQMLRAGVVLDIAGLLSFRSRSTFSALACSESGKASVCSGTFPFEPAATAGRPDRLRALESFPESSRRGPAEELVRETTRGRTGTEPERRSKLLARIGGWPGVPGLLVNSCANA